MGHVRERVARNCRGCTRVSNCVCTLAAICLSRTRGLARYTWVCVLVRASDHPRQCCTRNTKVCLRLDALRDTGDPEKPEYWRSIHTPPFKASGPIKPSGNFEAPNIRTYVGNIEAPDRFLRWTKEEGTSCVYRGLIINGGYRGCSEKENGKKLRFMRVVRKTNRENSYFVGFYILLSWCVISGQLL